VWRRRISLFGTVSDAYSPLSLSQDAEDTRFPIAFRRGCSFFSANSVSADPLSLASIPLSFSDKRTRSVSSSFVRRVLRTPLFLPGDPPQKKKHVFFSMAAWISTSLPWLVSLLAPRVVLLSRAVAFGAVEKRSTLFTRHNTAPLRPGSRSKDDPPFSRRPLSLLFPLFLL